MYYLAVRQFARTLQNLDTVLSKAEEHALTRGFDVNNFVNARLAPDMLPFVAQVDRPATTQSWRSQPGAKAGPSTKTRKYIRGSPREHCQVP